jgi:DNA primase
MIKKETELIKDKIDIVEFLRSYITLSPAGRNFKGICPFHQEKTPSLIVSPDKKIWKCFGCGRNGQDSIDFLMEMGYPFPEVIKELLKI